MATRRPGTAAVIFLIEQGLVMYRKFEGNCSSLPGNASSASLALIPGTKYTRYHVTDATNLCSMGQGAGGCGLEGSDSGRRGKDKKTADECLYSRCDGAKLSKTGELDSFVAWADKCPVRCGNPFPPRRGQAVPTGRHCDLQIMSPIMQRLIKQVVKFLYSFVRPHWCALK